MDLLAEDVMRRKVVTVRPDTSLPDLERRFIDEKLTGFPVVDGDTLRGVVSRSDIVRHLVMEHTIAEVATGFYDDGRGIDIPIPASDWVAKTVGKRIDEMRVSDVMSNKLITVASDTTLRDVARLLRQRRVHRVLVVDNGRLLGVVSGSDYVRLYAEERIGVVDESS